MHVIWDWNGTLFDDLDIVVESVNVAIAPFGAGAIDADGYRDHYQRPVQQFYDVLLGRAVTEEEWREIDVAFHGAYRERLDRATLHPTALSALEDVRRASGSQSVLSMWAHTELVPMVERLELNAYMLRVDGTEGGAGDEKAAKLGRHLDHLSADHGMRRDETVMVGDAFDDAHAAEVNGIACVLFASGSHHRHQLDATGHPVADSLTEALALASVGPL